MLFEIIIIAVLFIIFSISLALGADRKERTSVDYGWYPLRLFKKRTTKVKTKNVKYK